MIRSVTMRAARWIGVFGIVMAAWPRTSVAQGNLSTQGSGYPTGQMSTSALAAGGGTAEFDPLSPLNPAALATLNGTVLHVQYDPEFRTVSVGNTSEHSTTARFPNFIGALPLGSRLVVALSASTLLDRTWETDVQSNVAVGDTSVLSTATFQSSGAINDIRLGFGLRAAKWLQVGWGLHGFSGENRILVQRSFADTDTVKTATFTQNTIYSYGGWGGSLGVELFPVGPMSFAASYEAGDALRVRRNDTLVAHASVPPRAGANLRYSGIPGLALGIRAQWQGWSRLSAIGGGDQGANDAWQIGGGADITGPRSTPNSFPVMFHLGVREQNLPFLAAGQVVHETDFSGGLGLPVGGPRGFVDIALQHASRSANLPVSESAWTLSVGLTVRP